MKPKQIKLIKSLYKSADYERKEKIKECFPEVFELPSTGWLKNKFTSSIYFRTGLSSGYGFLATFRTWVDSFSEKNFDTCPGDWQPATKEEVETALIEEAKRRGVWDCPMVDINGVAWRKGFLKYNELFLFKGNKLWSQYGLVFDNGKWATPIEEETPNEKEDFETLYKKLKTKVTFSNEVILEIDGKRIKITLID